MRGVGRPGWQAPFHAGPAVRAGAAGAAQLLGGSSQDEHLGPEEKQILTGQ